MLLNALPQLESDWSCTHVKAQQFLDVFYPPNSWILLGPGSRFTQCLQRHAQIQRPALDLFEGPHQKKKKQVSIDSPNRISGKSNALGWKSHQSISKCQNNPKSKLLKFVLQIFLGHNTITICIQRLESLRFDAFIATIQTKFLWATRIRESWKRKGTPIEART